MKEYLYTIVEDLVKELRRDGINLNVVNVHSYLNGSFYEPEYPKEGVSNKYLPLSELGMDSRLEFENLSELKNFVNRLEDLLEDYPEVHDIEFNDNDMSVDFNYTRPPNEWEIKDYEESLESYNLIQEHADYIKTRYHELEKQDRDRHNARVLEEIEKLKKTLK